MQDSSLVIICTAVMAVVTAVQQTNADNIFVVNYGVGGAGWVGEYTSSGATVNANLISGFNGPIGIAASGTNPFVTNAFSNAMNPLTQDVVGEYTTAGQVVNASLITGLNEPISIAASGGNLYVGSVNGGGTGTIGEYTTSGAVVNPSLVPTRGATTYGEPYGLAISGNDLFVSKPYYCNTVGKYDATTGATVNAAFLTGLNIPYGLAVYDGHLLVGNLNDGTVSEYDANTGALSNPTFIQMGANGPYGMTIHDGDLFATNYGAGTIGEYDATTGATINATLVTGLTVRPESYSPLSRHRFRARSMADCYCWLELAFLKLCAPSLGD
jgi:hypothetical protein